MGAEVPFRVKVAVAFETEVYYDAVTEDEAMIRARRDIERGHISGGDLEFDPDRAKVTVIGAEPA